MANHHPTQPNPLPDNTTVNQSMPPTAQSAQTNPVAPPNQAAQSLQTSPAPNQFAPNQPAPAQSQTTATPTLSTDNIAPAAYGQKPSSKNKLAIMLIIFVFLVALAAGVYFMFGEKLIDQFTPAPSEPEREVFVDPLLDMPGATPGSYMLDDDPTVIYEEDPAITEPTTSQDDGQLSTTKPSATPTSLSEANELSLPKYTNSTYGFEVSYPDSYQLMTDSENLYGHPNGVALLYKGGQAYDIVIEVWDTEAEYQAAYVGRANDLKVIQNQGKFITILNNTQEPDNQAIIDSFKLVN